MMKTKFYLSYMLLLSTAGFISQLHASPSQSNQAKIAPICQKLFEESKKLITDVEKQPGTHTQIEKMKEKLNHINQQLLKMDEELQQKSCDKGLIELNNLQQKGS